MLNFTIQSPPGGPICDFCSEPDVHRMYGAESFVHEKVDTTIGKVELRSDGAWAACRTCADLIDNEQWAALTARAETAFRKKYGDLPGVKDNIRKVHDTFRTLMKKPA